MFLGKVVGDVGSYDLRVEWFALVVAQVNVDVSYSPAMLGFGRHVG